MSTVVAIAAIGATTRALGKEGDLLFKIPEDLERFRNLTRGHPVIMGRKTWESLPENRRPLPKRTNIVVTRQKDYLATGAEVASSIEEALEVAKCSDGNDKICIIGGGDVYKAALPYTEILELTLVDDDTEGDVYFPDYSEFTKELAREEHRGQNPPYTYVTLAR